MKTAIATALVMLGGVIKFVILAPIAAVVGAIIGFGAGVRRGLEWATLHALYNGDTQARDKDQWRRS